MKTNKPRRNWRPVEFKSIILGEGAPNQLNVTVWNERKFRSFLVSVDPWQWSGELELDGLQYRLAVRKKFQALPAWRRGYPADSSPSLAPSSGINVGPDAWVELSVEYRRTNDCGLGRYDCTTFQYDAAENKFLTYADIPAYLGSKHDEWYHDDKGAIAELEERLKSLGNGHRVRAWSNWEIELIW